MNPSWLSAMLVGDGVGEGVGMRQRGSTPRWSSAEDEGGGGEGLW